MQGTVRRLVLAVGAAAASAAALTPAAATAASAEPLRASTPVARLGDATITYGEVEQWSGTLIALGTRSRRATLRGLLTFETALLEAKRLGLRPQPRRALGTPRQLARLLEVPLSQARWFVAAISAGEAIEAHWVERIPPPSESALQKLWLRQRGADYFTPWMRRAELLELPSRAVADEALAAIRAGEAFTAVGARLAPQRPTAFRGDVQLFSDLRATPVDDVFFEREGGTDVLPRRLDSALFGSPAGELAGPIVTRRAVFVLRVTEVVAQRTRRPLPQVRTLLDASYRQQRERVVVQEKTRAMEQRWRARTSCDRRFAIRSLCGRVVDRVSR